MGVSPNSYEGQNRMPRPGNRLRSPPKDVPFGDPNASLDESLSKIMPEQRIVKKSDKSHSPARFGGVNGSDLNRSMTDSVGVGLGGKNSSQTNAKLKHKGLKKDKDEDKYEYYTSEDEHGRRI